MSSVLLWSSVQIGGIDFETYLQQVELDSSALKKTIEDNVKWTRESLCAIDE